jgi:hypothetical protein
MSSPESTLWQYVKRGLERELRDRIHLQRHEDIAARGIPDVSYALHLAHRHIQGWIELKVIKAWPKRKDTIVKIPKFTKVQRAWLRRRGALVGNCYFLLRVEEDFTHLLFDWSEIELQDTRTKAQLILLHDCWPGPIDFEELAERLANV